MALRATRAVSPEPVGEATALLRRTVLVENDLARLIRLFGDALSEDRVTGHFCLAYGAGGNPVPVLGDCPELVQSAARAVELRPDTHAPVAAVKVGGAPGAITCVLLNISGRPLGLSAVARVRGYATLYAARASMLRPHADTPTLDPLQRYVLGRLLAGDELAAIADAVDRTVPEVRTAASRSVELLNARDLADATAIAARRGWLLNMVNEFSALCLKK